MNYAASHIDNFDTAFKRDFFAYCQEPKQHSIISNTNEGIKISGWVLQKTPPKKIKILATSHSLEHKSPISLYRKDVIEKYSKANQFFAEQEICGFEIHIPCPHHTQEIQISIIKDNIHYHWFKLILSPDTSSIIKAKSAWKKYCLSRVQEITEDEIVAFEKTNNNEKKSIIIGNPIVAYDAEQLISYAKIPTSHSNFLYDFFIHIQNPSSISAIIRDLAANNKLTIPSPLGDGAACCTESFSLNANKTILKFNNNNNNEVFFVFQSISFCDGIYFPLRDVYVAFQDIDIVSAQSYLTLAVENFKKIVSYSIHQNKNSFLGLIGGHNRPYHYFYNYLPSLEKLSEDGVLPNIKNLISPPGCNYLKLSEIFPETEASEQVTPLPSTDQLIDNNQFICQIGFRFLNSEQPLIDLIERLDKKLRKLGQQMPPEKNPAAPYTVKNNHLKNSFPIIWFGIMSQKRCWVEQVPAAITILNELRKSFPSIAIIFDGWTSPLTPTETDKREIQNDLAIAEEIIKSLDQGILILNTIGHNATQKIHIANQVDCFIGNGAAGVIFVDRIANRHGIGHMNKEMLKSPLYLHKNITLIPPEEVNDTQASARADYVSYSINIETIKSLVKKILIEQSVEQRLLDAT